MAVCPSCETPNPQVGARCPQCQGYYYIPDEAAAEARKDPIIGQLTAGKYVILSLINEGGMGAVYRALQLPVEREVAFKVLRTELKDSDNGRDRFIREARAVSRLNHPNIITLYDFGFDDDGHPYMVMEYAPGVGLERWVRREGVTLERILHVIAQVLSALTEAHASGIVHRDLKPENMIVSQRGGDPDYVKLLDFGIARMINEGATRGLTREGEVFGTPHYMAPEQAQGKKEVGPPADIYAVGIMMWQMICGECPFDAPTPLAVLFMHISDALPPLRPKPGIVPTAQVEQIIQRACAKDPVDRYQTAGEMLTDVLSQFGSITGGLPGLHTDGDAGATDGRTFPAQIANRGLYLTPAAGPFATDVQVNDPGLSQDHSFDSGSHEAAASNRGLLIVAAVAIVAVIGAVAALAFVMSADPSEAQAEVAETAPVPEPPTEPVAVTEPEVVVEPIIAATAPEAEVPSPAPDAATADPAEKPVEKAVVEEKPEPKKPEPKKVERKKRVRKQTRKPQPKKVVAEPKQEEPTVTPGKWKPTVKPVTPTTWR